MTATPTARATAIATARDAYCAAVDAAYAVYDATLDAAARAVALDAAHAAYTAALDAIIYAA